MGTLDLRGHEPFRKLLGDVEAEFVRLNEGWHEANRRIFELTREIEKRESTEKPCK